MSDPSTPTADHETDQLTDQLTDPPDSVAAIAGDNAYASRVTADRWFAARNQPLWSAASPTARTGALIMAADWLDGQFHFRGRRAAPDQPRAWPRTGIAGGAQNLVTSLPQPVEQADFQLALALLEGEAAGEQLLGLRGSVRREQIGDIAVQYDTSGALSSRLTALLKPYLLGLAQPEVARS